MNICGRTQTEKQRKQTQAGGRGMRWGRQLHAVALAPHVSDLRPVPPPAPTLLARLTPLRRVCGPAEHEQMDLDPARYVSKTDSRMFCILPSGQHKHGGGRRFSGVVYHFLSSSFTSGLI